MNLLQKKKKLQTGEGLKLHEWAREQVHQEKSREGDTGEGYRQRRQEIPLMQTPIVQALAVTDCHVSVTMHIFLLVMKL